MSCWKRNKSRIYSTVSQRIPILRWLPQYNSQHFISDLIAGVTVGLTVMPQSLAYATLAGLEPQVITYLLQISICYYLEIIKIFQEKKKTG